MFDAQFYAAVLPQLVIGACTGRPDCTPVVQLHLADGTILEVCDVLQVAEGWLGIAYHRDGTCTGNDFTFLPHGVVTRVNVSLHPAEARRIGFQHGKTGRAGDLRASSGVDQAAQGTTEEELR